MAWFCKAGHRAEACGAEWRGRSRRQAARQHGQGEDYMTDDTTEARREQFLRTLTDMANANMALMDGTTAPFEKLIREHDVVFGVWQDNTFPGGVDIYTIK